MRVTIENFMENLDFETFQASKISLSVALTRNFKIDVACRDGNPYRTKQYFSQPAAFGSKHGEKELILFWHVFGSCA